MSAPLAQLSQQLARLATHYDVTGQWPEASLQHLTDIGAWAWMIPTEFGGRKLDPESQVYAYEAVAAGCMSTALILTQRDGACDLIAGAENDDLKAELLPQLARHAVFTTVGISQLTTSRQSGRAALTATQEGDRFILRGFMPWVTGAEKADFIVTGAVLDDDRQILAVVPTDAPGMQIDPPMQLMALQSSLTTEVHCKNVGIERRHILRGPCEKALASRSTVKPLVVAATGVGLAGSMIRLIAGHAQDEEGPLRELAQDLGARYTAVHEKLYKFAARLDDPETEVPKADIRVGVNDLLVRLAAGTLTFAKGSGFIRQRDAQRLVREAMFFLVWSAPTDVRIKTLASLLQDPIHTRKSLTVR